jgi:hypothetical protein
MRILLFLVTALFLSGCQNSWEQFYTPSTDVSPNALPYSGATKCFSTSGNPDNDVKECLRNGYGIMGSASFNSGKNENIDQLKSFGEKIGADLAIYFSGNEKTTQSAMVVPEYHPGQNQTTFMNGYSSNGSSFYGTANSYSSGTYTSSVVPVTITRRDYSAVFFRKLSPPSIGIFYANLSQEQIKQAGTNSGVCVTIVRRDSPAFLADIFEGDIITEVDDEKTSSDTVARSIFRRKKGCKVAVTILRNGSVIKKVLQLNP